MAKPVAGHLRTQGRRQWRAQQQRRIIIAREQFPGEPCGHRQRGEMAKQQSLHTKARAKKARRQTATARLVPRISATGFRDQRRALPAPQRSLFRRKSKAAGSMRTGRWRAASIAASLGCAATRLGQPRGRQRDGQRRNTPSPVLSNNAKRTAPCCSASSAVAGIIRCNA